MSDRDLTPDQDESVRALLASAKHTRPAPPEVVARLDDALAELVAERREARAPVVTLASRRRRSASTALLAAAAAVVFGVGVTQVLPGLSNSGDDSAAGSGSESFEDQDATESDRAFGAQEPAPGEDSAGPQQEERTTEDKVAAPEAALSSAFSLTSKADLAPQVRALRRSRLLASSSAPTTCAVPGAGSAPQVAITYDGQPGVVVYRAPDAGGRQVDVYLCGDAQPLESVRLRAR
jgi:hypothetical protein